jgi:hypothetical protein
MKLSLQFIIVSILVSIALYMHYPRTKKSAAERNFDIESHLKAYRQQRATIAEKQSEMQEEWEVASLERRKELIVEAREFLKKAIPNQIINAWYGTKWDFNGITEEPRRGHIACGYFVSTTLVHSGFRMHRVKMSQQASSIMIKSLCKPNTIETYRNMKDLEAYLRAKPEGLFILGLDKHVGYALREGNELWFIHSTVGQGRKVLKEPLLSSKVIKRSKIKMIGELSGNNDFIEAWLSNTYLNIKK